MGGEWGWRESVNKATDLGDWGNFSFLNLVNYKLNRQRTKLMKKSLLGTKDTLNKKPHHLYDVIKLKMIK